MSRISSYDSSSISTLFSSLNGSANKSTPSDMLGINYSDYATIKNGSYHKLMKAYYTEDKKVEGLKPTTSTAKDTAKTLAAIQNAAEDMTDTADVLMKNGSKSVFNKTSVKDANGDISTDYDKDAIYKAVKNFADSYNDLIEQSADSNTSSVLSTAKSLTTYTDRNEKLLNSVGITIGSDNTLKVDETTFKKADMSTVKSLFNTTGSFGYQVSAKASMIKYYAQNEAAKSNTYSGSGSYTYNYSTGQIYNSET